MNKLRLDIDEIQVESFEVAEAESGRGTVHAHLPTRGDTCTCGCSNDGACSLDPDPCSGYAYSCDLTQCDGTQCVVYCPGLTIDVCETRDFC